LEVSPLALLREGETGEIVDPAGGRDSGHKGHRCREHLENMGLRPGKRVEMIANSGCGPLILRLDEARIALGRGMAMKIYVTVRRNEE
jgi:ferrous iron transport protein A